MKITTFILICSTVFIFSCKKNDENGGAASRGPVSKIVEAEQAVDTLMRKSAGIFEAGFRFSISRDGKLTHLGCLFTHTGPVRVSLWDYAAKNVIASLMINAQEGKFVYTKIPMIEIRADRQYVLSINNFADGAKRDYFLADKKKSITSIYPINGDGITILAAHLRETRELRFPPETAGDQEYLIGIPDLIIE